MPNWHTVGTKSASMPLSRVASLPISSSSSLASSSSSSSLPTCCGSSRSLKDTPQALSDPPWAQSVPSSSCKPPSPCHWPRRCPLAFSRSSSCTASTTVRSGLTGDTARSKHPQKMYGVAQESFAYPPLNAAAATRRMRSRASRPSLEPVPTTTLVFSSWARSRRCLTLSTIASYFCSNSRRYFSGSALLFSSSSCSSCDQEAIDQCKTFFAHIDLAEYYLLPPCFRLLLFDSRTLSHLLLGFEKAHPALLLEVTSAQLVVRSSQQVIVDKHLRFPCTSPCSTQLATHRRHLPALTTILMKLPPWTSPASGGSRPRRRPPGTPLCLREAVQPDRSRLCGTTPHHESLRTGRAGVRTARSVLPRGPLPIQRLVTFRNDDGNALVVAHLLHRLQNLEHPRNFSFLGRQLLRPLLHVYLP
eukprot:scaffold2535_cov336-Prasinococcus_capsulatus_cf.AAC.14